MQGHQSKDCPNKVKCEVDGCQRMHSTCLYGAPGLATIPHTIDKGTIEGSCILQIMKISVTETNKSVNVLWDSAVTLSLITFKKAKELNLQGEETELNILLTGRATESIQSSSYALTLTDNRGLSVRVTVYGFPKISNDIRSIKVGNLITLFPHVYESEVSRPEREIDVLIGLDYASFHPQMVTNVNHLVLYQNRFGR